MTTSQYAWTIGTGSMITSLLALKLVVALWPLISLETQALAAAIGIVVGAVATRLLYSRFVEWRYSPSKRRVVRTEE